MGTVSFRYGTHKNISALYPFYVYPRKGFAMQPLYEGMIPLHDVKEVEVSSTEIRELIKENIKSSADYGKDDDGDGSLGDDEDAEDKDEDANKLCSCL